MLAALLLDSGFRRNDEWKVETELVGKAPRPPQGPYRETTHVYRHPCSGRGMGREGDATPGLRLHEVIAVAEPSEGFAGGTVAGEDEYLPVV